MFAVGRYYGGWGDEAKLVEPLKLGIYVLLLLPGFIYVQVSEHYLLREKKAQFEKTLEIILYSAFIWVIAFQVSRMFWGESGTAGIALQILDNRVRIVEDTPLVPPINAQSEIQPTKAEVPKRIQQSELCGMLMESFLWVCLWTFVAANLLSFFRKIAWVDDKILSVTGRDWYPAVAYRFFHENVGRAIIVTVGKSRYGGRLIGAPDNSEDRFLLLGDVHYAKDGKLTPMGIESILIRWDEVEEIQSYPKKTKEGSNNDERKEECTASGID